MDLHITPPEGTRDRLFAECLERRQVQAALVELFRRRGYAEVITPEMEYYDLFVRAGSPLPQQAMLKVIDRSGRILVMRPDSTAPIARVAATKLKGLPLPQRLYYDQAVFRLGDAHDGGSTETAQCGVELIGAVGRKADVEMVALAVDALHRCGVEPFHIEVGHADFFRTLAARLELSAEGVEQMRACIEGKNYAALNDLLAGVAPGSARDALARLPYLFGGVEVLEQAAQLAGPCKSLDYLAQLYEELDEAGYGRWVRFGLGLVHQMDYYTGVVFRGYVQGAGRPVLSGGRYDKLVERFGRRAEATGFAVDVDAVGSCLEVEPPRLETVIHYGQGALYQALQELDSCPPGTCELSPCRTLNSTLNLAREKGAGRVLVLEKTGRRWLEV